jgi:hypothetical protein
VVTSVGSQPPCHYSRPIPPRILNYFAGWRGERSTSCTGCFTPAEIIPITHWIEGLVGPTVGLDAVEEIKVSYSS